MPVHQTGDFSGYRQIQTRTTIKTKCIINSVLVRTTASICLLKWHFVRKQKAFCMCCDFFPAAESVQKQTFRSLWLCIHRCPLFRTMSQVKRFFHASRYSRVVMYMCGSKKVLHHALGAQLAFVSELYLFVKNRRNGTSLYFSITPSLRGCTSDEVFYFFADGRIFQTEVSQFWNRLLCLGKKKRNKTKKYSLWAKLPLTPKWTTTTKNEVPLHVALRLVSSLQHCSTVPVSQLQWFMCVSDCFCIPTFVFRAFQFRFFLQRSQCAALVAGAPATHTWAFCIVGCFRFRELFDRIQGLLKKESYSWSVGLTWGVRFLFMYPARVNLNEESPSCHCSSVISQLFSVLSKSYVGCTECSSLYYQVRVFSPE